MELQTVAVPNSSQKYVCSLCGTDLTPELGVSTPGLNRLVNRSVGKGTKCIWLITIIICAIVCVGLTIHQMTEYFKSPVASVVIMDRKDKVQFPSFSICAFDQLCYLTAVENEIKRKCIQNESQNCDVHKALIHELNISLEEIWDQCHLKNVFVNITSRKLPSELRITNHVITYNHFVMGHCAVISHTEKIPYVSSTTALTATFQTKYLVYYLVLHGLPEFKLNEFEPYYHQIRLIQADIETALKIREVVFELQNTSSRLCYDLDTERENTRQQALEKLTNGTCRLPYLPDNFPPCQTLHDFRKSTETVSNVILNLVGDGDWRIRRVCNEKVYTTSVDYTSNIYSSSSNIDNSRIRVVFRFADETDEILSEYFTYTFPALVSDLFAYWGFFLCLSALVFAELVEFVILKIYQGFKKIKKR